MINKQQIWYKIDSLKYDNQIIKYNLETNNHSKNYIKNTKNKIQNNIIKILKLSKLLELK